MTDVIASGCLHKMAVEHVQPVDYSLILDEQRIPLNSLIGSSVSLHYSQRINCIHCGRKTKKSFNQGYCYPCFKKLAQCDTCIMSPERCHYDAGTCREPEWGEQFCMTDHIVYLANSSGLKVGITRSTQVPIRWMDQGATAALPIFRVATRQQSGLVEDALREFVPDKTNWRKLLKGETEVIDLQQERDRLLKLAEEKIKSLQQRFGVQAITPLDSELFEFSYPVTAYQTKVKTHNFDKEPIVEGILQGIHGQYLLLDTGAINLRKFTGYHVEFRA